MVDYDKMITCVLSKEECNIILGIFRNFEFIYKWVRKNLWKRKVVECDLYVSKLVELSKKFQFEEVGNESEQEGPYTQLNIQ